uniref:Secretory leukocyte peptidase inhibitor n=1 Tax=Chrysemys picta bellii TaxID=8478 RepID=A0A8C3HXU3_CHRPI
NKFQLVFYLKSGTCPVVTVRCLMINPPNRCNYDHQCPGPKKCCETGCGRACVLPVPLLSIRLFILPSSSLAEKPRTCPVVTVRCRMINPPNRCNSDHQCPGFKKCCETFCGRACVYPKGHGKDTSLILSLGSGLRSLPAPAGRQGAYGKGHFNPWLPAEISSHQSYLRRPHHSG